MKMWGNFDLHYGIRFFNSTDILHADAKTTKLYSKADVSKCGNNNIAMNNNPPS